MSSTKTSGLIDLLSDVNDSFKLNDLLKRQTRVKFLLTMWNCCHVDTDQVTA